MSSSEYPNREPSAEQTTAKTEPEAIGRDDIEAFASRTPVGANAKKRQKKAGSKAGRRRRLTVLLCTLAGVLVLGGAAALLTYVLIPEEEDEPETELPDTSVVVLDKTLDETGKEQETPVKSVHISSLLDDYTLALTDDGILKLTDGVDLSVNTTNVNDLVEQLTYIKADAEIASGLTSFTEYGLDAPTATVEVTYADDTTAKLELASLAVGSHYYLRLNGGDTVYLLDSSLPDEVMQKAEAFVGLTMIASPAVGSSDTNGSVVLKELSLTGTVRDSQILTVRRKEASDSGEFDNSSYLLTAPYLADTNVTVVNGVFNVTAVSASEVVALHPTEEQKAEYGLDTPYSVAKIVLAVYTQTTDSNGNVASEGYYNETPHLVLLGGKNEYGEYYAMVDNMDVVFSVAEDSVPWAEKTYHDFASQYLFLRNLNTLASISCTVDGQEYPFLLEQFPEEKELDDQLRVTMNGTVYPTDQFRELYKVLMTLYRTGPAPAEPTGDPILTVRVTSIDKSYSVKEVKIYPYSGSVYIARSETGDTYKVTASRVDDAIQQIRNYLNGENVVNRY